MCRAQAESPYQHGRQVCQQSVRSQRSRKKADHPATAAKFQYALALQLCLPFVSLSFQMSWQLQ